MTKDGSADRASAAPDAARSIPTAPYREHGLLDSPAPGSSHHRAAAAAGWRAESRRGWPRIRRSRHDVVSAGERWHQRAVAAERTAQFLRPLLARGWTVLHDRAVGGRGAVVDHLVIGPAGLWLLADRTPDSPTCGWAEVITRGETADEIVGAEAVALQESGRACQALLTERGLGPDQGWQLVPHVVNVVHGATGPIRRLAGVAFTPAPQLVAYLDAHPVGLGPAAVLELTMHLEMAAPAAS